MTAFWLSRFVEIGPYGDNLGGIVPAVARDQWLLDGQVSVWRDLLLAAGDTSGYAICRTPSAREAWHNPPETFALGLSLQDQCYGKTYRALANHFGVDAPITVLGQGVPARAGADVIDLGATSLTAGDTVGVEFSTAGGLNDRPYWVAESDGRYIRVATEQAGQHVDITSNGTCTVYRTKPVWRVLRWLYRNGAGTMRTPDVHPDGTVTLWLDGQSDRFDPGGETL